MAQCSIDGVPGRTIEHRFTKCHTGSWDGLNIDLYDTAVAHIYNEIVNSTVKLGNTFIEMMRIDDLAICKWAE